MLLRPKTIPGQYTIDVESLEELEILYAGVCAMIVLADEKKIQIKSKKHNLYFAMRNEFQEKIEYARALARRNAEAQL